MEVPFKFLSLYFTAHTPGGNGCLSNIARGWLKEGVGTGEETGIPWGWVGGCMFTSAPAIISLILFTATKKKTVELTAK